jgi:dUTP pyrophosphatase
MIEVKVRKLSPEARLPQYKSDQAAGADLYACIQQEITVPAFGIALIPTGLALEIPPGYQGEVRARSGLTLREGLFVLNGPGTIDSDYRGEVKVILANFGSTPKIVRPFDRIAQLIVMPAIHASYTESALSETLRQENGFGSTGKD